MPFLRRERRTAAIGPKIAVSVPRNVSSQATRHEERERFFLVLSGFRHSLHASERSE